MNKNGGGGGKNIVANRLGAFTRTTTPTKAAKMNEKKAAPSEDEGSPTEKKAAASKYRAPKRAHISSGSMRSINDGKL